MAIIRDVTLRTKDGSLHFRTGGLGREAVILMHPNGTSTKAWAKVEDAIAERWPMYSLDMLGQGDSSHPDRYYAPADYASSVVNFMKATALPRATFIGNSVGAMIAALVAATHPNLVRKLVLVGCPAWTEAQLQERLGDVEALFGSDEAPPPSTLAQLRDGGSWFAPTQEIVDWLNADRAKAGAYYVNSIKAIREWQIRDVLARVKAPTLVVYGEVDQLRDEEAYILEAIAGAELRIVPRAGHLAQYENPEGFLETVLPFVEAKQLQARR